ncbi:MAG: peptidase M64, partial [Prevotella sp.]|nr:peptidase M64 [Prevotella sp.]
SYNLSMTHHRLFRPVVVHEFGHSFAGLADEYAYENEPLPFYPFDVEPWEPNITTLVDFDSKWKKMLPKGTKIPTEPSKKKDRLGVYEGAGYSLKGVYRGALDCRMRTNENPEFCPVCRDAITKLIKFYTE